MGIWYLASLIVGLGILLVQVSMGGKDGGDHDGGGHGGGASKDFGGTKDLGAHGHDHAHDPAHGDAGLGGLVAIFFSTRFWIFGAFGFGFSGTLLHYFLAGSFAGTLAAAIVLGLLTGGGAAFSHRALMKSAARPIANTSSAAGTVGHALLPIEPGTIGQVRIELQGRAVDLRARTDGERIERGDAVVIEEVEGELAIVSRAPRELH
ncbi:MAG: hypothetical protein EXR75_04630 [Myxococcales bacterium]|nr:hypothetical protein [Myxococcales bacterium]